MVHETCKQWQYMNAHDWEPAIFFSKHWTWSEGWQCWTPVSFSPLYSESTPLPSLDAFCQLMGVILLLGWEGLGFLSMGKVNGKCALPFLQKHESKAKACSNSPCIQQHIFFNTHIVHTFFMFFEHNGHTHSEPQPQQTLHSCEDGSQNKLKYAPKKYTLTWDSAKSSTMAALAFPFVVANRPAWTLSSPLLEVILSETTVYFLFLCQPSSLSVTCFLHFRLVRSVQGFLSWNVCSLLTVSICVQIIADT